MSWLRDRLQGAQEKLRILKQSGRLGALIPDASERNQLLRRIQAVSQNVECPHFESEMLTIGVEILSLPESVKGCVVEAGCFKGGSTAKLSLFVERAGRELVAFDSFEGLPENDEVHERSILGHSIDGWFDQGKFCGRLEEVEANVRRYGQFEVCRFVRGWFEQTMPVFREPIALAFLDVDLAQSTRTCLKKLWPILSPGGVLYSQDGDFPLVIDVLADSTFWEKEVGCARPEIEGLGKRKLLRIEKPV